MCDYSLHSVKSYLAQVRDRGHQSADYSNSGRTRSFAAPEDKYVAVCLLPGTELSFSQEVRRLRSYPWTTRALNYRTAIFRQINKDNPTTHHDALEFPDGQIVLVTYLEEGQTATVLQLPAESVAKATQEAALV